jgi:ferric-dicitrate binding protein FerR (iron transport regulator)
LLQDGKRVVRLSGEAYFQIQKDGAHPFIVESPGQRVEVLGTHFNINSYTDEKRIRTTLLEGSVKVISLETGKSTTIQPDQQAIWDGKNLQVVPVIAEESIDWKEGVFSFEDEGLQSVMRKVARWYDVEIEYRGTAHDRQTFSGSISRSENISQVLKTLSKISSLDFQMENRKIIISSQSR